MKLAPSLVIAMALVVSPLSANAEGKFMGWYVEGHLGMAALGAVSTSYSGSATLDGLTYDGKESLGTEYNRALAFGAEFGARDIGRSGVRLGLALTQFTPEIDSRTTTFSGKAPDNDTVVTVIRTGAHGDESEDTKVGLYGLNVYYDFDSGGLLPFSFTPPADSHYEPLQPGHRTDVAPYGGPIAPAIRPPPPGRSAAPLPSSTTPSSDRQSHLDQQTQQRYSYP